MNLIGAWRMKGVPRQCKKDILDQGTWTANQTILDAAFGVEDIPSLATVTGFLRDTRPLFVIENQIIIFRVN